MKNEHSGNHIVPFLWMHGEDETRLRETVKAIHESSIGALCVESRPHPDFLGPKWWRDMDVVLDECKKRNMKVWILDDEKFPTGYSAGRAVGSGHTVRYLKERHVDIIGPQKGSSILISPVQLSNSNSKPDTVVSVVAARRIPGKDMDHSTYINIMPDPVENLIDLTAKVIDDVVYWDIPEGLWRIFVITSGYGVGNEKWDKYINPLEEEGTQILLDTVYEAHYRHYKDDFGKTIKGFFSDEPQFGGGYGYHCRIGHSPNLLLPWTEEVLNMMSDTLQCDAIGLLPGLWTEIGEITGRVRFAYMDAVTRLYGQNFCCKIGDWCRAHGVEYMGHVIEENNAHGRLGAGTGHYFRALWGQDLAGIDIVLNGLIPGIKGTSHAQCSAQFEADDDFFYYCLAQMAASLSHIDKKKHGRAMCEIFGAYGWQEGLREMKWLADFMMSRGINVFVPHAFTPKNFPDPDCPPHFFARGENPQYRYFGILMRYMNRICNLISGGHAMAQVGVLYHAEAEWASEHIMKTQEIVKLLTQRQIEADILPIDALQDAPVNSGKLLLGECQYRALVVPYAEKLPANALYALGKIARSGVKVIFADGKPLGVSSGICCPEAELAGCEVLSGENIIRALDEMHLRTAYTTSFEPDLKLYPYAKDGQRLILMFNEGIHKSIDTVLSLPEVENICIYDPYEDRMFAPAMDKNGVALHIDPWQMLVLIIGSDVSGLPNIDRAQLSREIPVHGFKVSIASATEYPAFTACTQITQPMNLNSPDVMPRFSGTIRYEGSFEAEAGEQLHLSLGEVGETAEVFLNGIHVGTRIVAPYEFDLTGLAQQGENKLTIDVTNTLVYRMHDALSSYHAIAPSGLIGPIALYGA